MLVCHPIIVLRSETLEIKWAVFFFPFSPTFSSEAFAVVHHIAVAKTSMDDITLCIYFFLFFFHSQHYILCDLTLCRARCWHLCHYHLLERDMPWSTAHSMQSWVTAVDNTFLPEGLNVPMLLWAHSWMSLCRMSGRERDKPSSSFVRRKTPHCFSSRLDSKHSFQSGRELTHPLSPRSLWGPPSPWAWWLQKL